MILIPISESADLTRSQLALTAGKLGFSEKASATDAFFLIRHGEVNRMLWRRRSSFEIVFSRRQSGEQLRLQPLHGLTLDRPPGTAPVSSALLASCSEVPMEPNTSSGKRAGRRGKERDERSVTRFSSTEMRKPSRWPVWRDAKHWDDACFAREVYLSAAPDNRVPHSGAQPSSFGISARTELK